MHDIDRAMFEMEQMEGSSGHEFEWGLHETQEMELASELLEVHTEAELDRFLGKLLGAAKSFASSDAGRAVGGLLKSTAKQVLPGLGQMAGDLFVPGVGGQIGSKLASVAASTLELEGLSREDREFEGARAFVRFANEAADQAASAPPTVPPAEAAVRAATVAAQRHLPRLEKVIQRLAPPAYPTAGGGSHSGRWVRRGPTIVLFNV